MLLALGSESHTWWVARAKESGERFWFPNHPPLTSSPGDPNRLCHPWEGKILAFSATQLSFYDFGFSFWALGWGEEPYWFLIQVNRNVTCDGGRFLITSSRAPRMRAANFHAFSPRNISSCWKGQNVYLGSYYNSAIQPSSTTLRI